MRGARDAVQALSLAGGIGRTRERLDDQLKAEGQDCPGRACNDLWSRRVGALSESLTAAAGSMFDVRHSNHSMFAQCWHRSVKDVVICEYRISLCSYGSMCVPAGCQRCRRTQGVWASLSESVGCQVTAFRGARSAETPVCRSIRASGARLEVPGCLEASSARLCAAI
ncbi:hypothetical protein GY45DRAFT_683849 [Cubamyces sp. BRFM 1775]|nr:hypothetical protein GY45DRAFT_683849 [Cubamyces sp. BRFM 1775]